MSVTFADHYHEGVAVSAHVVDVGRAVAASIPWPSRGNGGLRETALWWATHVGRVFPLTEARTDTLEPTVGKVPHPILGRNWTSDTLPSRDLTVVRDWWSQAPMANVGLATRASGFVLLDVDPRHGGWDQLRDWARKHGIELTHVPRALSPRNDGGCHLWWRLPFGATYPHSPLLPGVDRPWQVAVPHSLRYVVVDPESRDPARTHALRPYLWYAGDPRHAPLAHAALLGPGTSPAQHRTSSLGGTTDDDTPLDENGRIDVDALAGNGVAVGKQSYTFKRMACAMVARGWDDSTILRTLVLAAHRSPVGDPSNPWSEHQLRTMLVHARRFIQQSREKEALSNAQVAWAVGTGRRLNRRGAR